MSKALRERVYRKYNGRCAYCGSFIEYKAMQIDHYLPQCKEKFYARRCKKDVHAEENLMPSCRRCNHYKRARTPKQFRELMKTLHERLESIYILKVAIGFGMATIKPFDGLFYFEKCLKEGAQSSKQPVETNPVLLSEHYQLAIDNRQTMKPGTGTAFSQRQKGLTKAKTI